MQLPRPNVNHIAESPVARTMRSRACQRGPGATGGDALIMERNVHERTVRETESYVAARSAN